jgi:hypothetical protein
MASGSVTPALAASRLPLSASFVVQIANDQNHSKIL